MIQVTSRFGNWGRRGGLEYSFARSQRSVTRLAEPSAWFLLLDSAKITGMAEQTLTDPAPAAVGETRGRVLDVLCTADEPMGVRDIAERVALHPNTARFHLDKLVEAGLAERRAEERNHPGRPRLVYSATSDTTTGQRSYRLLAEMLTSLVADTLPEPGRAAEVAGEAWGRYLAERPSPTAADRRRGGDSSGVQCAGRVRIRSRRCGRPRSAGDPAAALPIPGSGSAARRSGVLAAPGLDPRGAGGGAGAARGHPARTVRGAVAVPRAFGADFPSPGRASLGSARRGGLGDQRRARYGVESPTA